MISRRIGVPFLAFLLAIALTLASANVGSAQTPEQLLQQSRQLYEAGQLDAARIPLQQLQQQSGDPLVRAAALSNLALIYSEQGNWSAANQAIAESLQLVRTVDSNPSQQALLAQTLNLQGRLQLAQGQTKAALDTWRETATLYRQLGNARLELQTQLRQVQALQAQGLHGKAYEDILLPVQKQLQQLPDSDTKVWALRTISEAIAMNGKLDQAKEVAAASLAIAQNLKDPEAIAASQLTMANLIYARIREMRTASRTRAVERQIKENTDQALALYRQIAAQPSTNRLRAQLNQLALLVDSEQTPEIKALVTTLQPEIVQLPPNRSGIEARLNFANSLLRFQANPKAPNQDYATVVKQFLTTAVDQAKALNDPRLLANALGNLARSQEQQGQLATAQATTERALLVANTTNATDQVYRWTAQLGRLQEKQKNKQGAIASYSRTVKSLNALRQDVIGLNTDLLPVDQESFTPVYRQLVNLLLPTDGSQPDAETLKKTREVIESLQLEEINNYLRAACLQASVAVDQVPVPNKTAVVYPMILENRIATIVSVNQQAKPSQVKSTDAAQPDKPDTSANFSKLYSQDVREKDVQATTAKLQRELRGQIESLAYIQPAKDLYNWLIKPIETELQQQEIETLVFVLDGPFRNIPMAALFDGKQFLIEKYSIGTTPGLKLTNPQPLQAKALSSVAFGLTLESKVTLRSGETIEFSPLPSVEPELENLQKEIPKSVVHLDKEFTKEQFKEILQKSQAPIVHLATHGQFSSNRERTFLVTSNGPIDTDDLAEALGAGDASRTTPIELLVLSACETAAGDDRAPLGLAGIALKSGARSTIASLWKVSDLATSMLMQEFYKELATRSVTKAEALRRAQISILKNPQFRHPYNWAPFVLVGNWL